MRKEYNFNKNEIQIIKIKTIGYEKTVKGNLGKCILGKE